MTNNLSSYREKYVAATAFVYDNDMQEVITIHKMCKKCDNPIPLSKIAKERSYRYLTLNSFQMSLQVLQGRIDLIY